MHTVVRGRIVASGGLQEPALRQLPRILLSLALTPAIFSSVAVAPQCTMFLLMRCVWYVTKGFFLCLVVYAVRSTPLRAARPMLRDFVALGGEIRWRSRVQVQEDAHAVFLHAQRVVVVAAMSCDPSFTCLVVERPVPRASAWFAAQVVVACLLLGVAEAVVVPDVLFGAAALRRPSSRGPCGASWSSR